MGDRIQGVFGEFKPVLDPTLTFTGDEVQGVFGKFEPVFDPASTVGGALFDYFFSRRSSQKWFRTAGNV